VIAVIADEQFKWFYWLGPILGVACLGMLLNMSVNYLRKVVIPRSRGRRVD
jgi:hypothetical protein